MYRAGTTKQRESWIVEPVFRLMIDGGMTEFGYSDREGQQDMALDVADAIASQNHLMVEAGVGIGKSFAYLIPALYACERLGRPIIIATSSISLSEQLAKDASTAMDITGIHVPLVVGKGMTHYACAQRATTNQKHISTKLFDWVTGDLAGDRNKIPFEIPDPEWNKVMVERCTYERCKYKAGCTFYNMRSSLKNSGRQIMIVNQDLLLVSLVQYRERGNIIIHPAPAAIVIDEAHNFEEKARSALTISYTNRKIGGILVSAHDRCSDFEALRDSMHAMAVLERGFRIFEKMLWTHLESERSKNARTVESGRISIGPTQFISPRWFELLNSVADSILVIADIEKHQAKALEELYDELKELVGYFREITSRLAWVEIKKSSKNENWVLNSAPEDLGLYIQALLFRKKIPVILTSATLCVPGHTEAQQYSYRVQTLGFCDGVLSQPKPSPFSYSKNAVLYVPEDMPNHKTDKHLFLVKTADRIIDLCHITNGRTLVLFTAKDDMDSVFQELRRRRIPWQLHVQANRPEQDSVIEEFKKTHGILLGSGVFWEGINIKGPDLSSVIIVRLPFPVPDPIIEHKLSVVQNKYDVLIPEMLSKLRQGGGRLIRDETDTGVLSIFDRRVSAPGGRHRRSVLDALPIKNVVDCLQAVETFANERM